METQRRRDENNWKQGAAPKPARGIVGARNAPKRIGSHSIAESVGLPAEAKVERESS